MDAHPEKHEQKIGYSRGSLWAPFHAVGMVARIQGNVPTGLLESSLQKLRMLYPPLASHICIKKDGSAWLTTEGTGEFQLEVLPRASDEDWINIFLEQERLPFDFDRGPLARFFLLRSDPCSDLIVIAPHVICDGYSMIQVITDAVALLNDPDRSVTRPSPPPVATWQTVSHSWSDNLLLRGFIGVINLLWPNGHRSFHQKDYEEVNRFYWARRQNGLLAFDLSPSETSSLIIRCKQRGVTVTGALVSAFLLAQADVQPKARATPREISVAVNIRDRMLQPPGQVVGVYASNIRLIIPYRPHISFWELANESYARIHRALNDRRRILWPLALGELDPTISDTMLAALCTDRWGRQLGMFTRLVRMGGLAPDLDVSNIGRVELPEAGRPYRLETIIPLPPLVPGGGLALNVLTVAGRMNVILKYRLDQIDSDDISKIKEQALSYLTGE